MPKVVRFHQTGNPEVLRLEELPLQEPKENELRIKVQAIGLNRAEAVFRRGQYFEQPQLPARIGYEASGIVDAVGPGVTAFKVGDKISSVPGYSQNQYGAYGEWALVPVDSAFRYPQNLSPVEAAAIWMQYLTAWGGVVYHGKIQAGQSILIPAASSSVGLAAIELARLAGAQAIAATRTSAKKQALLDFGADAVVVTGEEDLPEAVRRHTNGRGVDLIFDPVAGSFVEKLMQAAAPGAQLIEYGGLSGEPTPFPMRIAMMNGLSMRGYTLMELRAKPELLKRGAAFIFDQLQASNLKPKIDRRRFTLDQIVEAHRYMESNQQIGKIIVTV